ncbi:YcnI family copper-binding membrane protein, partial [Saccharomonospora saliphila]|uniref:YcnI family copper-binding membrane protein n=1 Tax=Saccharomonospora saliphila TaxID=369829 RepID=UPI0003690DD2
MSTSRLFSRCAALTATVALTGLAAAGTASAHVTANVYGEQPEQGGYGAVAFRVPNEKEDVGTTEVALTVPAEYGISSARTKPVPGWTASVSEPDDVVTGITFTADEGTEIPAGTTSYEEFHVSLGPLPEDVDTLVFAAAQTYSDGSVVNWDQDPTSTEGEPEHPAPVVDLAASSGDGHGSASGDGGADGDAAESSESPEGSGGSDETARWLGGA